MVWVQDYHLMLLPSILKQTVPRMKVSGGMGRHWTSLYHTVLYCTTPDPTVLSHIVLHCTTGTAKCGAEWGGCTEHPATTCIQLCVCGAQVRLGARPAVGFVPLQALFGSRHVCVSMRCNVCAAKPSQSHHLCCHSVCACITCALPTCYAACNKLRAGGVVPSHALPQQ